MDDVRSPEIAGESTRREPRVRASADPAAVQRWQAENKEALDAFSRWYKDHGSPLDEYRAG